MTSQFVNFKNFKKKQSHTKNRKVAKLSHLKNCENLPQNSLNKTSHRSTAHASRKLSRASDQTNFDK